MILGSIKFRPFALLSLACLLYGCQQVGSGPIPLIQYFPRQSDGKVHSPGLIESAFLAPAGSYSMVTVRQRPNLADQAGNPDIMCVAPSPDWATALATANALAGSGGVSGGASASLNASNSSSETITALAGRTAGVVALRDGLFSACQAYASGIIGKDAYALILSQYGNLLVALAGGSGGGGSASSAPAANTPSGVAVAVSTGASSGSTTPASGNTVQSMNSVVAQMQQEALQAMLVACISENDPTVRVVANSAAENMLLKNHCDQLVEKVVAAASDLLRPADGTTKTLQNTTADDKTVKEVQTALKQQDCSGCSSLTVDGIDGPKTKAAVTAYQKEHGLPENSNYNDPATMKSLRVTGRAAPHG